MAQHYISSVYLARICVCILQCFIIYSIDEIPDIYFKIQLFFIPKEGMHLWQGCIQIAKKANSLVCNDFKSLLFALKQ